MRTGLAAAAFAPALVAGPVKANVTSMAGQFVAGATPADLVKRFGATPRPGSRPRSTSSGETVVSEAEADAFLQRNLEVLDTVGEGDGARTASPASATWVPAGPFPGSTYRSRFRR